MCRIISVNAGEDGLKARGMFLRDVRSAFMLCIHAVHTASGRSKWTVLTTSVLTTRVLTTSVLVTALNTTARP